MALPQISLFDKYSLETGRIYLSGIQALVRLPLMQKRRDMAMNLNTAGFISGYRGSPLGTYDQQLMAVSSELKANAIHFQPGVNEDLAATAVWGSQQLNLFPGALYDGVFGLWYGKAPGVDRSGDVFRHANAAGTAPNGGVLLVAGDDHACKSSSIPSQSEFALMDLGIPVLNPANVQEVLDFGMFGWALSRYSGCWVGLIAMTENMDSSATVDVDPLRHQFIIPKNFEMPAGGLNIQLNEAPLSQEDRLRNHKLKAAVAFARANPINKITVNSPKARIGIVTTGKADSDFRQATELLGIEWKELPALNLRVLKLGMTWPLDTTEILNFADGLEEILIIEEKRSFLETQLKEILYHLPDAKRPRIVGKQDMDGSQLLIANGELTPEMIAQVLVKKWSTSTFTDRINRRFELLHKKTECILGLTDKETRSPFFCSGCPHNTSTNLPEGSRALAGIGCHYMARWMDRRSEVFTQMGGEGMPWVGQAPFTSENHVFANLGDGTYYHSGYLAIRAAIAAKVNITYKILYNDAVAMTGGQAVDGPLSVTDIILQVMAEGVREVAVVTDAPQHYKSNSLPSPVKVWHRDYLDTVQKEFREKKGCTVIVYEQTCAAELRRRRKKGLVIDPPKRAFINDAVCEGCGDCSVQSNCISVEPLETDFGIKRKINQSSCNKDMSCVKGFCPSFVTIKGGAPRKGGIPQEKFKELSQHLPLPVITALDEPYNILITGIGGTGVITIASLMAMAAHLQGKGATTLDMTGLAQKNGSVFSHIRIANNPEGIPVSRIPSGSAHLLLAFDAMTASTKEGLVKLDADKSASIINTYLAPTGNFVRKQIVHSDTQIIIDDVRNNSKSAELIDATKLATSLTGDAVNANVFLLGFAFQKGLIPLSLEALEKAIELNGVKVKDNKQVFACGRMAAHNMATFLKMINLNNETKTISFKNELVDELIERRALFLTEYQDKNYADRYREVLDKVKALEARVKPGSSLLAKSVANNYFKLLAYKDEYEVARLYTNGDFLKKLNAEFDGNYKMVFNLAPPILPGFLGGGNKSKKFEFGGWMMYIFKLLARLKFLRGTKFDIFSYLEDRKAERKLIQDYDKTLSDLLIYLNTDNFSVAIDIVSMPEQIRGYGHIKMASIDKARLKLKVLQEKFKNPENKKVVYMPNARTAA